jgi:DNA polymerase-3 subunit beta
MQITTLKKEHLKIADFASKDDSRPILTTVLVRWNKGNVELVATDSYTLVKQVIAKGVTEEFEQFMVPAVVLQRADKLTFKGSRKKPALEMELSQKRISIPEIGVDLFFTPMEGKYPDFDRLITDIPKSTDASIVLNPRLVMKVGNYIRQFESGRSMTINVHAKLSPTEFICGDTYAVIMPLKG